jgi:signal transduction histidine kinase
MKRFSHPGSDEMKLLDVNMAIENTVTVARNEWKYHSEIEFDLDPEAGSLMCFTGDFNQVLLNMLVNAAQAVNEKYKDRQDKGVIRLGTRRHEHALIVTIADTGTGIAEKNLHRIYDPFFTTKEVGKGTGQGLAIVHDIVVNKHGGSVEVQTELGKGTTFVLKFPLSGKHEEAA